MRTPYLLEATPTRLREEIELENRESDQSAWLDITGQRPDLAGKRAE